MTVVNEQLELLQTHDRLFGEWKDFIKRKHSINIGEGCKYAAPTATMTNRGQASMSLDWTDKESLNPLCALHGWEEEVEEWEHGE